MTVHSPLLNVPLARGDTRTKLTPRSWKWSIAIESSSKPRKVVTCVGCTVLSGATGMPISAHMDRNELSWAWPTALSLARSWKSTSTCEMFLMCSLLDAIHCNALLSVSNILQLALQPEGQATIVIELLVPDKAKQAVLRWVRERDNAKGICNVCFWQETTLAQLCCTVWSMDWYCTCASSGEISSLIESPGGYDRWWISLNLPGIFFSTRPRGDVLKCEKVPV